MKIKAFRLIIFFVALIALFTACRKRNDPFKFAGAWKITKVEQVSYSNDTALVDVVLVNDTLGWFALQNASGSDGEGKMEINYATLSPLKTDMRISWSLDEHNGDRLNINDVFLTRVRLIKGEKWTWITSGNSGKNYTRETIYVERDFL